LFELYNVLFKLNFAPQASLRGNTARLHTDSSGWRVSDTLQQAQRDSFGTKLPKDKQQKDGYFKSFLEFYSTLSVRERFCSVPVKIHTLFY